MSADAMTSRERVLACLRREPTDRMPLMPITMMFAADRIGVRYGDYVRDHRVMVEAQIRTAEEFGFDYVSVISDPAREATDCGADVAFYDDQPPAIRESNALLADKAGLNRLRLPDPLASGGRMRDRVNGVALFRERDPDGLRLIEGWIEGPCAMGADLRGINNLMPDFHEDPDFVSELFEFCFEMELSFARAQIAAGCDIIGLGDAAASLVGPAIYDEFVWPIEKRLVDSIHDLGVPVRLHICGNTRVILDGMGRLGCEMVDIDFLTPMSEARAAMGADQVLLGNIDPVGVLRNGSADGATAAIAECHQAVGDRFIVGAGCEVCRDTPLGNVRAMCDYAFEH